MADLLKRIIRAGWFNFIRNIGLSLATCFIIGMTIFLIASLFLLRDVTRSLITTIQEKVDISVYFKDLTPEEGILELRDEISKIPEVKKVEYISQVEALDRFIQRNKDNSVVMESLSEVGNPFLSSLNVATREASQYSSVVSFLENSPQKDSIDKIDYYQRKPVIERLSKMTSSVNIIGIILSLILAIMAILVAFNQIRLAIYSSREEIKVQRLVGASNWFIRGPFLAQGAISGIFAAIVTILVFTFAVFLLSPKFATLSGLNLFNSFLGKFWLLFLIQFLTGIGIGILSSIVAIRKYLEV